MIEVPRLLVLPKRQEAARPPTGVSAAPSHEYKGPIVPNTPNLNKYFLYLEYKYVTRGTTLQPASEKASRNPRLALA
jgi:predicted Zn-dependent protease